MSHPLRRRAVAAVVLLGALALTGCRASGVSIGAAGGGQPAGSAAVVSAKPIAAANPGGTGQPAVPAKPAAPGSAANLTALEQDLAQLSSADSAVSSDLQGAASEAAQSDNG